MADDAGALLVRSGLVSSSALDEARAKVNDLGGTLGEQLVAAGVVTDDSLTDFYKKRLLVPQVNPNSLARLPAKVVAIIPSDMAIEMRAIPVSLDADNNLTIAMSDPSDRHAVDEIAAFTGTYVVRAVATQMQIAWCLAHYYGHVTNLGQRLLKDEGESPRPHPTTQPPARPRARGITGQIEASRHRAIVPGEAFADSSRQPPRDTLPEIEPVEASEEPTPVDTKKAPRGHSISGEIRVPGKRAPSIKPPLPDDSGPIDVPDELDSGPVIITMEPDTSGPIITMEPDTSGPVMTIEADEGGAYDPVFEISGPSDDPTDRTRLPVPKRRRPADPDPPELAARAGEVQLATGAPIKKIIFDEPRIIVSEELEEEARPRRDRTAQLEQSLTVSGEIRTRDARNDLDDELASIFVELGEEDGTPSVIHDPAVDQSQPVLLDRRREPGLDDAPTSVSIQAAPPSEIQDELSDVVVLDARKAPPAAGPRHRNTQVGIGPVTATTRARMFERTGVTPEELEDQPTGSRMIAVDDRTRLDAHAAPPADYDSSDELLAAPPSPYEGRDTSQIAAVPAPSKGVPGPSGQISLDRVQPAANRSDEDEDDVRTKPTLVMSAVELDEVIPGRASLLPGHLTKKVDYDPTDEGWGPPGTTIPPPLLGAIPGASDDQQSGVIPMPNMDSAPLMIAPPVPPERPARAQSVSETGISRALEAATARVLELIHTLDHTTNRDQVVAVMIAHLAETHQRAGFFAARGGELSLFAITPRVPVMPTAALRLDRPSTLQDVVGTRLPYRGPMLDEVSRLFLQSTLGACPPEILLVPVAVRERVVGVLFGDNRMKHTFDDQLALAARAAGMALERILKAKRGER